MIPQIAPRDGGRSVLLLFYVIRLMIFLADNKMRKKIQTYIKRGIYAKPHLDFGQKWATEKTV